MNQPNTLSFTSGIVETIEGEFEVRLFVRNLTSFVESLSCLEDIHRKLGLNAKIVGVTNVNVH